MLLGGPNGAGKTTLAPSLLRDRLGIRTFVNADTIALGLSGFSPQRTALVAGKIMLRELRRLAAARESFTFETTLASRSFVPWIKTLKQDGYSFILVYVWLNSPELSLSRVEDRVRRGGHHVPESAVRRRYVTGLRNFFNLYAPIANYWRFYDNSSRHGYRLVASNERVLDPVLWRTIQERHDDSR
ncbi:MAG: zeta toxin family protein [Planctomycetes bacterium]|nr:zeta toxin family protein [Planctomycetota bacterium]